VDPHRAPRRDVHRPPRAKRKLTAHPKFYFFDVDLHYWRTQTGLEVDFVLYGERGLHAFEVKRAARLRGGDYDGLRAFAADYPMATCTLAYGGTKRFTEGAIEVVPIDALLAELPERLDRRT